MRHRQLIKIRNDIPICIETPEGLIRIEKKGRSLLFDLPGEMTAHMGEDRALAESRFLHRGTNGIEPKYTLVCPKVEDGELVGVTMPPVRNIADR